MQFLSGIASFFSVLPLDWLILGAIVIVIALDALRSGVGRAVAVSLALPIAFVLFQLTQHAVILESIGGLFSTPLTQAFVFGALFVILYLLIRRMGSDYMDTGMGQPIQALLSGAAVAVIFSCIWLLISPLNELWTFSATVQVLFSESFRFWWLIAAYSGLAFARG